MTVDVWMRWREGAPPADAVELLSPAERQRYDGMRSAEAAACFLSARALVRELLSEVSAGIEPSAWRFEEGSNGKPHVVEPDQGRALHFNVAHTNGFAIALVSKVAVGVDVENTTRDAKIDRVARRFFAESEADWVLGLPNDEKRQAFFDVWTMKEAVVKCQGEALGNHLSTLVFVPDAVGVCPRDELPSYSLRRFEFGEHLVGLAVNAPVIRLHANEA